jgi:phosphomannomutase
VATREIAKERAAGRPTATIVYNVISSAAVPEIIAEAGGTGVRTRVGHSFIKGEMARNKAVFGGEHSAHYYFRDFWFADTGMLAALHVLAALGEQSRPISEVVARFTRYAASGEINSTVADAGAATAEVRAWAEAQAPPDATPPDDPSLVEPPPVDTSPVETSPVDTPGPEIEPWLREILRCPNCGSTLSDGSGPGGPELHCTNAECRLAYRIDDGIPVLLVDESRSLAD